MHGRERNAGIADEAREGDKDQVGEDLAGDWISPKHKESTLGEKVDEKKNPPTSRETRNLFLLVKLRLKHQSVCVCIL